MAVQGRKKVGLTKAQKEAGLSLFDIKRRRGTPGSIYDSRSAGGIRSKTSKKPVKKGSKKA